MTNNIIELLSKQDKSLYWLAKETGIRYQTVYNLAHQKTDSAKFQQLKSICKVLNCTLDELFNMGE